MRESWDACEIPAALVWDSRIFGGPKAPRNDGIWELGFEYLLINLMRPKTQKNSE